MHIVILASDLAPVHMAACVGVLRDHLGRGVQQRAELKLVLSGPAGQNIICSPLGYRRVHAAIRPVRLRRIRLTRIPEGNDAVVPAPRQNGLRPAASHDTIPLIRALKGDIDVLWVRCTPNWLGHNPFRRVSWRSNLCRSDLFQIIHTVEDICLHFDVVLGDLIAVHLNGTQQILVMGPAASALL